MASLASNAADYIIGMEGLQLGMWWVNVFVNFTRCFICILDGPPDYRLNLMHGTLYRRVADTVAWVYDIEHIVSCAYALYNKLFCSWSCSRPNHNMYVTTVGGDTG
jgi:hypothetical protein